MSLSRVVVTVTGTAGGGWSVDVRVDSAGTPIVPVFGIDAATLPDMEFEQHVPVVPNTRRQPAGPSSMRFVPATSARRQR